MKVYRIYLGLTSPNLPNEPVDIQDWKEWIEAQAQEHFPYGITMIEGKGLWECSHEPVIILEVITWDRQQQRDLINLGGRYKDHARQEAVLFTEQEIEASLI